MVDPVRQGFSPYVLCGDNPINGYDEDGRVFWVIAWELFQVYSYMSMSYNLADAAVNHGAYAFAQTAASMGFSMGMGAAAGAIAPDGGLWGGLYGAASGGITSWALNDFKGGIFNSGMISGAVMGGIEGYQRADAMGKNPLTGAETAYSMKPRILKYIAQIERSIDRWDMDLCLKIPDPIPISESLGGSLSKMKSELIEIYIDYQTPIENAMCITGWDCSEWTSNVIDYTPRTSTEGFKQTLVPTTHNEAQFEVVT